jgi:16S rRNA (adenine1518-N6/adenine1519-N6)-dimethyltransferase
MASVYQLLKKYHFQPKKGLGQNFLADQNHLEKIVAAAELSPADVVLEIGPGLGALSVYLAARVKNVTAIEIDPLLVDILKVELSASPNFQVVQANILALDPAEVLREHVPSFSPGDPYYVVANLPYYITSAILQHLLEAPHPPARLVVTVQKEVAQRIVAKPGQMSLLAVSVQFYGRPRLAHTIPAQAFVPPPKVDSAVLRIDRHPHPQPAVASPAAYFRLVKAGFSQKRKQLKNSLAAGLGRPQAEVAALLTAAGIDPTRRAETLSLDEWAALVEVL